MNNKFKKMFDEVGDLLFKINRLAIKEGEEDAKNLSCNIIEIIDSCEYWN